MNNKAMVVCLSALLCGTGALAQQLASAVLNGEVTDPSGAALSGAEVVVQSKDTGITRTTATNATGLFIVNALSPGEYEIRISAKGFSPATTQVRLEVGQQQDLKIRLQVNAEKINVSINSADAGQ